MFKIKPIQLLIILLLGVNTVMAKEDPIVTYEALYRMNDMHCIFLVNGVTVQSSSNFGRPQLMSLSGRMGVLLAEGKNTIGIQAIKIPDSKDEYCEMTVTASVENPKTGEIESREVTMIKVTIDKNGDFTTEQSPVYPVPTVTNAPQLKVLDNRSISKSDRDDVLVTRDLTVNHPHKNHSWTYKSTPFTDTAAHRAKLWEKYEAFRTALANKDEQAYRALLDPGMLETDRYQAGDPENRSYTESIMEFVFEAWEAPDFKVLPVKREDFELQISAEGRLFRFIETNDLTKKDSPIEYQKKGEDRVFNFSFTLINGEIVVAY